MGKPGLRLEDTAVGGGAACAEEYGKCGEGAAGDGLILR